MNIFKILTIFVVINLLALVAYVVGYNRKMKKRFNKTFKTGRSQHEEK